MKATRYYQVAEHIFSVITEPVHLTLMQNYEPFRCSDNGDVVFTLTIDSGETPAYTEETFSCLTKSAVRSTKKQNVNSTTESSRPIPTKP